MHFHQSSTSPPELLITSHLVLHFGQKSMGNDLQLRLSLLAGADHHPAMKLALGAFASGFSTSTLQFIDCSFDHRSIGKERFDEPLEIVAKMKKGLPKPTEFLSL
jgi:hypothetical protein